MARLQVILDPLQSGEEEAASIRTHHLTAGRYRAFCRANPELRIERSASGEVLIMPSAHSRTGHRNPSSLPGHPELPGFALDLSAVWNPVV